MSRPTANAVDDNDLDLSFKTFLEVHLQQLTSSNVPERYWRSLFFKLKHEIYDAGLAFQMNQIVSQDDDNDVDGTFEWKVVVTAENGISLDDPKHVYLIDHAWTYRIDEARAALRGIPGLVERMAALMDLDLEGNNPDELVEGVLEAMWKYNQTYRFGHFSMGSDDAMPLWYIMDEFGSRIEHSEEPSVQIVPFYFAESHLTFSLMWPLKALEEGDEVTRNYIPNVTDPDVRKARLLPWISEDLRHIDYRNEEPGAEHFLGFKMQESLPSISSESVGLPRDRNVRVYLEYSSVVEFLTDPRFELVQDPEDADVLWYLKSFRDYRGLSETRPHVLINQFPNESVITVKDLLAITARRASSPMQGCDPMEPNPRWLPVTYNLQTEMTKFVSYFQHREDRGLDNHWICKPWNLARGLDTYISKNINQIVRLPDAGPKVACKYIENPVLFYRDDVGGKVKFDIRYIVLVSSFQPLKMFAYQVFWLRFSNKSFSLDTLDDYEKHFTVMNYVENAENKLKQLHYDEFIPEFESQYPSEKWADIENDIFLMFKELFEAAGGEAPRGIGPSPQSRAMYAVDLMLAWSKKPTGEKYIQPMICEVNFSPDCARACKYHPFFINDVFSVLFLDDVEDKHVVPL